MGRYVTRAGRHVRFSLPSLNNDLGVDTPRFASETEHDDAKMFDADKIDFEAPNEQPLLFTDPTGLEKSSASYVNQDRYANQSFPPGTVDTTILRYNKIPRPFPCNLWPHGAGVAALFNSASQIDRLVRPPAMSHSQISLWKQEIKSFLGGMEWVQFVQVYSQGLSAGPTTVSIDTTPVYGAENEDNNGNEDNCAVMPTTHGSSIVRPTSPFDLEDLNAALIDTSETTLHQAAILTSTPTAVDATINPTLNPPRVFKFHPNHGRHQLRRHNRKSRLRRRSRSVF